MNFSYSKLTTFEECRYAYDCLYNNHMKPCSNVFADYGSFMHSCIESYYKGENTKNDLIFKYQAEYDDAINNPIRFYFSPSQYKDYSQIYYDKGFESILNLEPFEQEIVAVEQKFEMPFGNHNFTGIIDLILRDNDDFIIVDHKSSNKFSKKELKTKQRQLYLYSLHIKDKYGKYPKELWFNHFKANHIERIKFDKADLAESIEWAKNVLHAIESCKDFGKKTGVDTFCLNMCGFRVGCVWGVEWWNLESL